MEHLSFDDLRLFARMAALGSLSAVARERLVSVAKLSRALDRMEQASGKPLFQRTTQGLSLTPDGDAFLRGCVDASGVLEGLRVGLSGDGGDVQGHLSISASASLAEHWLVPSLPALHRAHPRLRLDIRVNDRVVDLGHEGVDVAIRAGTVTHASLVARHLGTIATALYASPGYLAAWGVPTHSEQLVRHQLLANCSHPVLNHWVFATGPDVHAEGPLRASTTSVLLAMALQGLGVVRLPCWVAREALTSGRLVPVLAHECLPQAVPVHAVFSPALRQVPRLRVCVDHWVRCFDHATQFTN
jgi:DNA-binding transcriptional LysR family regulator